MEENSAAFINLTKDNLETEHISCIIRSKKVHPGIEAKKRWLKDRLEEGHVFRNGCLLRERTTIISIAYGQMGVIRKKDMARR